MSMQAIFERRYKDVDVNLLVPLNRWSNFCIQNENVTVDINRHFFVGNKNILLGQLYYWNRSPKFIKYHKTEKFNKDRFDFVSQLLQRKYKYGTNEIESMKRLIEIMIKRSDEMEKLAGYFGLELKDRKKLGLKVLKPKIEKSTKKIRTLF